MELIYNKIFLEHETGMHPENKVRLLAFKNLKETKLQSGEKFLRLVHPQNYINSIKSLCEKEEAVDPDTITSKNSYEAACYAAYATILASEKNDFALVRPPGHHALSNKGMGFCLFNNIAVASQKLVNEGKKVFILDFDGHYGNGTAEIFYNSNKVLYLSTHQFPAYPGTGWVNEIGEDKGKGYNICIPMPPGSADDIFLESINYFIPKIKNKFNPDIVGVSAGFDAHHSDPLLNLHLTTNSYYEAGKLLSKNFNKIFATLEGGYNINFLPRCVYSFLDGINNKKISFSEEKTTSEDYIQKDFSSRLNKLKETLKNYLT